MKELVLTLATTILTIAVLFGVVVWADNKREKDQLNEKTKYPESWEDDLWGM